jgi:hypothetical protein
MADVLYALSVKQPWATLLAHGHKTIEIRRWATARRGRILIHAARVSDPRPEGWKLVPSELVDATRLVGGIVGAGKLINCITYDDREAFARDSARHRNSKDWFQPPRLYGFEFTELKPLPFRQLPGWMRFFQVPAEEPANAPS